MTRLTRKTRNLGWATMPKREIRQIIEHILMEESEMESEANLSCVMDSDICDKLKGNY